MKKYFDHYFDKARSWSEDCYVEAVCSRNRYRFAFVWSCFVISLLIGLLMVIFPLQHDRFVMVHHMNDGTVWYEQPEQVIQQPQTKAALEADIVRYVMNRESYSAESYYHHFFITNLLSDAAVSAQYRQASSPKNMTAFVHRLGKRFVRSVTIQNVLFISNDDKKKLVQVNFIANEYDRVTHRTKSLSELALIRWAYRGQPKDPQMRWLNWDGFVVTDYNVQQRNLWRKND